MAKRFPWPLAAAIDVLAVLVFVGIGLRSHEESDTVLAVLGVAAPFVLGLAAGWAAVREGGRAAPLGWGTATVLWLVTLTLGMTLRRFAFGDGTAWPFVLVATGVLALFFFGWRALARLLLPSERAADAIQ